MKKPKSIDLIVEFKLDYDIVCKTYLAHFPSEIDEYRRVIANMFFLLMEKQ